MNHTIDECYSKHGYPPWYKQRTEYNINLTEKGSQDKKEQHVCNLNVKEDPNDKHNVKDDTIKGLTVDRMQKLLKLLSDYNDSSTVLTKYKGVPILLTKNPKVKTSRFLILVQLIMLHKIKVALPPFSR